MSLQSFFQLVRWKNLVMIALIQLLFRYVYFPTFQIATSLNNLQFLCLVVATLCIAAGGNIINDIKDIRADIVNKPKKVVITSPEIKKTAFKLYYILNILGFILGLYISCKVNNLSFVGIFIMTALLLQSYSTFLKKQAIIGNLVVALLISLSIIIVGVFDIIPSINEQNGILQYHAFYSLIDYAIFAFILNFIREIVKDIEDVNGDIQMKMKTLPILFGRKRTRNITFIISFIPLILFTTYIFDNFSKLPLVLTYMLVAVMIPFLYFMSKLLYAEKKADYHKLSNVLKLIMLSGMLSIIVISISMNYA